MLKNSFRIGMALFTPGDVVWAKMRGHPPWPAEVTVLCKDVLSLNHCLGLPYLVEIH